MLLLSYLRSCEGGPQGLGLLPSSACLLLLLLLLRSGLLLAPLPPVPQPDSRQACRAFTPFPSLQHPCQPGSSAGQHLLGMVKVVTPPPAPGLPPSPLPLRRPPRFWHGPGAGGVPVGVRLQGQPG
jgi:hypothetical protein